VVPPTTPIREFPSHEIKVPFGRGLAANTNLDSGTVVEQFVGELLKYEDVPLEHKVNAIWFAEPDLYISPIGPAVSMQKAFLANHSCNANSFVNNKLEIVTKRPLKTGEEITITYNVTKSDGFWDPVWDFECRCGSSNCMKNIDGYVDSNFVPYRQKQTKNN